MGDAAFGQHCTGREQFGAVWCTVSLILNRYTVPLVLPMLSLRQEHQKRGTREAKDDVKTSVLFSSNPRRTLPLCVVIHSTSYGSVPRPVCCVLGETRVDWCGGSARDKNSVRADRAPHDVVVSSRI